MDIIIVGAGPIGLMSALELALHGVKSTVLNQEAGVCHGSRAIVLTRRSLDILNQAGALTPFVEKGLFWNKGNSYYKGEHVYRMDIPHLDNERYLPCLNLQQPYIEQFLIEACVNTGLVEVLHNHKVTGFSQLESHATLEVEAPQGALELKAKWVIAADGGRSFLRKQSGMRMEGKAYAGNFVIVDIRADIPLPTERLCYFEPDWSPGNNVLVHKQPDSLWRLDYRLPDDETAEFALQENRLHERIKLILKMIKHDVPYQVEWATVYSASTLTLPDYRQQRLLFVGDAAHLLPIFGVRGANTGFMDANNLGWKLALVVKGEANAALLDSYSEERVPAARQIIEESGKSTRFMTPPTKGFRMMRDAVLELSLAQNFVKDLLHWRTSKPQAYVGSSLNSIEKSVAMPNIKLENGYLLDMLASHHGFKLLTRQKVTHKLKLHHFVVKELSEPCIVLRPDNHICAIFHEFDEKAVLIAINKAKGAQIAH